MEEQHMASGTKKDAEIRVNVDSDFLRELQEKLGVDRATDVARSALTLLDWAANEVQEGRVILSSTGSGTDVHRLVMPELTSARRKP
jgi:hypothetical protein